LIVPYYFIVAANLAGNSECSISNKEPELLSTAAKNWLAFSTCFDRKC